MVDSTVAPGPCPLGDPEVLMETKLLGGSIAAAALATATVRSDALMVVPGEVDTTEAILVGKVILGEACTTRRVPMAEGVTVVAATPSVVCGGWGWRRMGWGGGEWDGVKECWIVE